MERHGADLEQQPDQGEHDARQEEPVEVVAGLAEGETVATDPVRAGIVAKEQAN